MDVAEHHAADPSCIIFSLSPPPRLYALYILPHYTVYQQQMGVKIIMSRYRIQSMYICWAEAEQQARGLIIILFGLSSRHYKWGLCHVFKVEQPIYFLKNLCKKIQNLVSRREDPKVIACLIPNLIQYDL